MKNFVKKFLTSRNLSLILIRYFFILTLLVLACLVSWQIRGAETFFRLQKFYKYKSFQEKE